LFQNDSHKRHFYQVREDNQAIATPEIVFQLCCFPADQDPPEGRPSESEIPVIVSCHMVNKIMQKRSLILPHLISDYYQGGEEEPKFTTLPDKVSENIAKHHPLEEFALD
jgi:acyl-CoA synthetase (AMP-forming)/AMP-acid ligase II